MDERAQSIGLVHAMESYEVGCGISFQDFNNDGWDDITIGTTKGRPIIFYLNNKGSLAKMPALVNNLENVRQVLWIDYDNDGDKDLYVSAYDGLSKLYRQDNNLIFRDVTAQSDLPIVSQRAIGATWGDVNRDGWLDLYYSIRKNTDLGFPESQNRLFLNYGGIFTEASTSHVVKDVGRAPFCAGFIDINKDLWPDIYIANDRNRRNTLFLNQLGEKFEDISESSGSDLHMNAMSVSPLDINSDLLLDVFVSNTNDQGNKLLINQSSSLSEPFFKEEAETYNLLYDHTAWSSIFFDADNDRDQDLFISGTQAVSSEFSSQFYENQNSNFQVVNYFELMGKASHVSAKGDINNDGSVDILVQYDTPDQYQLWVNQAQNSNNYLSFSLTGVVSNREGIGCHIYAHHGDEIQYLQTYSNTGFLGQDSDQIHIGIGTTNTLDSLLILWPSGHRDRFYNLESQSYYNFTEGETTSTIHIDPNISLYDAITATNNLSMERATHAFPNPFQTDITIETKHNILDIKLYNLLGYEISKSVKIQDKKRCIITPHIQDGIYILFVKFDHSTFSKKIIKLKTY